MTIPGHVNQHSDIDASITAEDRIELLANQIAGATPHPDPALQSAAVALLRLLAQGDPVEAGRLAEALALPAAYIDGQLERTPGVSRDEQRRVVGFMGLSVVAVSEHRIHIDGRSLWTWCAWDALFLPELLGNAAHVTSRCPGTRRPISLSVTPAGVTNLDPPETVVSFLAPEGPFDANVTQSFCHFVHFFASPEVAARWTAEHPGTFALSVEDAYRVGQLTNRATFGAVLATSSTT